MPRRQNRGIFVPVCGSAQSYVVAVANHRVRHDSDSDHGPIRVAFRADV